MVFLPENENIFYLHTVYHECLPVARKNKKRRPFRPAFLLFDAVLFVELINTAAGIDELLLAGVEGMALGAYLNGDVLAGGAGLDQSAAGTSDDGGLIVGVNSGFHIIFSCT